MARRLLTAALGLPLLLALVVVGGWWLAAATAALAALGAWELCALARRRGVDPSPPVAALGGAAVVLAAYVAEGDALLPLLALGLPLSLALRLPRGNGGGLAGWAVTVSAALYPGLLLAHGPLLRERPQGAEWLLLALAGTFAADTAAFLVGRAMGRRPLAPAISPAKTWEGAIAGLLAAAAVSTALVAGMALDLSLPLAVLLGLAMGLAGQVGDLAESRMKRWAGAKDSGSLLPGHGGLLDRLDSIVFNLVVVYYFLIWKAQ